MWSRLTKTRIVMAIVLSMAVLGMVACGGADEDIPAPAAAPAPAAPAPVAPAPAAPAAASLIAGITGSGMVDFNWPGPTPTKFIESPRLAALVKAGQPCLPNMGGPCPSIENRMPVPEDVLIIPPSEKIGKHGGSWRRVYTKTNDHAAIYTDHLWWWNGDGGSLIPHLAKNLEFSSDGRQLTITLRRGHKYSDGAPFDADAIVWNWNNLFLNKDLQPNFPTPFKSPISGNEPKLEKIDDVTVRLTWDDPNFAVGISGPFMEGSMQNYSWSFSSAGHYLKQFHKEFAKPADLAKLVADAGVEDWIQLIKIKRNGYDSEELPGVNAWVTTNSTQGPDWVMTANPYYHAADPAGNQLPYIDEMRMIRVEGGLEAVKLKAVAGEIDYQGRHIQIRDVPLYRKFAAEQDYWVKIASSGAPNEAQIHINQTYGLDTGDKAIGDLLRTRDFRRALSLGIDRTEINETFFLGMGQERAFVPSSGTVYYPGEKWEKLYAVRDVAEANKLLDGIGLTEKDVDGFRLKPGSTDPLTLHFDIREGKIVDFGLVAELVIKHWADLGIKGTYKTSRTAHKIIQANDGYLSFGGGGKGWSPWIGWEAGIVPLIATWSSGILIGTYVETDGAQGVSPTDPRFKNPEGEFPFQKILDLYAAGKGYPMFSPDRTAAGQDIFKILTEEVVNIGTVGGVASIKGVTIVKNYFKNVPENVMGPEFVMSGGMRPELYFIDK